MNITLIMLKWGTYSWASRSLLSLWLMERGRTGLFWGTVHLIKCRYCGVSQCNSCCERKWMYSSGNRGFVQVTEAFRHSFRSVCTVFKTPNKITKGRWRALVCVFVFVSVVTVGIMFYRKLLQSPKSETHRALTLLVGDGCCNEALQNFFPMVILPLKLGIFIFATF